MIEKSAKHYYSGFELDYNNKTFEILFDEQDNATLMSVWEEEFKQFTDVNLCLSGGIDSQFLLYVLTTLKKNVKIYIFSWLWEDCVFNSPDVLHAIRFCKKHNLDYTNIDIDYKKFVNTAQLLGTCKKYKTNSPQIALQLHMLDFIENNNTTFLGADTSLMQFDFKNNKGSVTGINYQFFTTMPFLNYSNINNRLVIKDIFKMTPLTHYLSYKQFIETTKKYKLVYPCDSASETVMSIQPIKKLQYDDLGADNYIMEPLLKNTGFEILKMHLAKESGIYNQYDMLYRFPLLVSLNSEDWYTDLRKFKVKIRHPAMKSFLTEYEEFCMSATDLKQVNIYNFIL